MGFRPFPLSALYSEGISEMEQRTLGRSGLWVSRLCLGTMTFGQADWGCDEDEAQRVVGAYLDAGGNFFDCADIYAEGRSEEILGKLVASRRSEVVISTKVGMRTTGGPNGVGLSRAHMTDALHASLRRLGTDYIDVYFLHYFDANTPLEETLGVLADFARAGKIRYVGCSNFFAWQLAHASGVARQLGAPAFVSCQMMYNLVRRDLEREHFAACNELGMGLVTWSPLHSGVLATGLTTADEAPPGSRVASGPALRKTYLTDARVDHVVRGLNSIASQVGVAPSTLAMGWVLRRPEITSVLTGIQHVQELKDNIAALDVQLDDAVWDDLDRVTALPSSYPSDFYGRLSWTLNFATGDSR
jgi:aryl-alcohol dehydrogenase-like predicted oxidoreductase